MKYKLATTCLVLGSVLAPVTIYAADSDTDRSKPTHFVKDSVITTEIKTKLAAEHLWQREAYQGRYRQKWRRLDERYGQQPG